MEVYVVRDWNEHFETAESRKLKHLRWVAMPNKHDGKSYRRLMRKHNGATIYGVFVLIVQVASKCPIRGVLADVDGPLTVVDISDKTMVEPALIQEALDATCDPYIGWMEKRHYVPTRFPDEPPKSPDVRRRSGDSKATPGDSGVNLPKNGEIPPVHNITDITNTPLPPNGGDGLLTKLGEEDLESIDRLAAWILDGCQGVSKPIPEHKLSMVVACAREALRRGRRPMRLFWTKVRTLSETGDCNCPGEDLDEAKRMVRAWKESGGGKR